jgi:hypothetical protein
MRYAPYIDPNEPILHLRIAVVHRETDGSWHFGQRRQRAWLRATVVPWAGHQSFTPMRYGAAFYAIFLPTWAVSHGELTKGALGWQGQLESSTRRRPPLPQGRQR